MAAAAWTTPDDVVRTLRRRWQAGAFLTQLGGGQPWAPLGLPLRGPAPGELAARFDDAAAWVRGWDRADGRLVRVERKRVGGRAIGTNDIPCRAWVDSFDQLWALLGVQGEVSAFTAALALTRAAAPRLAGWVTEHPGKVLPLAQSGDWERVVGTVRWIDREGRPGCYLRQVDVPGVDTKFIERHRGILTDLLDLQLAPGRIDPAWPRADFAGRYRFRKKPAYVRFRHLRPDAAGGFSELTVRAAELAAAPPGAAAVYVIENEITYLAFPPAGNAIAIFGGGYAVSVLESLAWLADRELFYWGDIDTHGFAILSRLRGRFPHARSLLMDRATLLAHRSQWVAEPSQAAADPGHLLPPEAALYRDLLAGTLGDAVRLEQERISFAAIEAALPHLTFG